MTALDTKLPWTARTASEKARARRLVASGRARIASTAHETYIGKRGVVNYEALDVEPMESPECPRCAGSGITGHRIRTGSYVGPGPVPDDASGFVESRCSECRGSGRQEH